MKKTAHIILLLVSTIMYSCSKPAETTETVIPEASQEAVTEAVARKETDPMTPSAYEEWVPQSILQLPLTESGPNNQSDIPEQGVYAYYDNGAGKNIELRIVDMSGELEDLRIVHRMTIGKERHNRDQGSHYRKAVEKAGYVANETHDKNKRYTFLRFIHEDRYLVDIKANGFTPDELWNNLNQFQLNKLKQ